VDLEDRCRETSYLVAEPIEKFRNAQFTVITLALCHVCAPQSWRDLLAGQLPTLRTIPGIGPAAVSLITHPLLLAVIATLCGGGRLALLSTALALIGRLERGQSVERHFGGPRNSYSILPVRELLPFPVRIGGLFGSSVTWRRHGYCALSDGTLRERHEVPR